MPEAIEYVKSDKYKKAIKSFAGRKAISPEKQKIQEEILTKKQKGEQRLVVYEDYKNFYSLSGFNKIWYKK